MQVIQDWIVSGREEFMRNEQLNTAVVRKLHELPESVQRLRPSLGDRLVDRDGGSSAVETAHRPDRSRSRDVAFAPS